MANGYQSLIGKVLRGTDIIPNERAVMYQSLIGKVLQP